VTALVGNYEVSKWLTLVPHPYIRSDAEDFLRLDCAGDIGHLWVIAHDGKLAGVVSVGNELGYWLGEPFWGHGFMTEAAQVVVDYCFASLDLAEIKSSHFVENAGSRRVLEKLGFQDVGAHIHFSRARQAEVPGRSMLLTRAVWEARRHG
jgi:RimJ/RimL family protein N-acetyltransferase